MGQSELDRAMVPHSDRIDPSHLSVPRKLLLPSRSHFSWFRVTMPEKMAFFYQGRHLWWNRRFPTYLASVNFGENISRKNVHDIGIAPDNLRQIVVLQKVSVQVSQVQLDL